MDVPLVLALCSLPPPSQRERERESFDFCFQYSRQAKTTPQLFRGQTGILPALCGKHAYRLTGDSATRAATCQHGALPHCTDAAIPPLSLWGWVLKRNTPLFSGWGKRRQNSPPTWHQAPGSKLDVLLPRGRLCWVRGPWGFWDLSLTPVL